MERERLSCMKKFGFLVIALTIGASQLLAQGQIDFSNYKPGLGIDAPVYEVDNITPLDSGYLCQLLIKKAGDPGSNYAPVDAPVPFRNQPPEYNPFTAGRGTGYFSGGVVTIPYPAGTWLEVVVAAWDSIGGTIMTYKAAVAARVNCAETEPFLVKIAEGPFNPPPVLSGLKSFHLGGTMRYRLSTEVWAGVGSVRVRPGSPDGKYNSGTAVQLLANPALDYVFSSWSGDVTGSDNPVTIIMNGTKSVSANLARGTPQINYTFDDGAVPAGADISGTYPEGATPVAYVDKNGGLYDSGVLKLTTSENHQVGGFRSPLLAGGAQLGEFIFKALHQSMSSTGVPADGFSINFAPDLPILPPGDAENGAGTGITVTFDVYDNEDGDPNNEDGEAPSVDVWYQGKLVAVKRVPLAPFNAGAFMDLRLHVTEGGLLSLLMIESPIFPKGIVVYDGLQLPGYEPMSGLKFALYARTGGLNADFWFDNIELYYRTSVTPARYSLTTSVLPSGAGSVTSNPAPEGDGNYAEGTVVTLSANPSAGYAFSSWSGDASGGSPTTITMTGHKMVTANFVPLGVADLPGLRRQYYAGIPGQAVSDLTASAAYPHLPDAVDIVSMLESPSLSEGGPDWHDDYGQRLRGWLVPPQTGTYVFYLASDDQAQVFLSTDESPYNKRLIVQESSYTLYRNWEGTGQHPARTSAAISLKAGERYYLEVLHKEGGGGDNVAVAWQLPGGAAPKNGDPPIGNSYLVHRNDMPEVLFHIEPPGSGTVSLSPAPPPGGQYPDGTVVTFTALANAGYRFVDWSKALTGSANPASLTIIGQPLAIAHFIPSPLATPQLSYDFNDGRVPAGAEAEGIFTTDGTRFALVDKTDGVDNSGVLKLTTSENGQVGGFRSPLFASDAGLLELTFSADFLAGKGTSPPADGFSINFAPDLPILPPGDAENGAGTGITVAFDTFDNVDNDPNNGTGEAPSIDVLYRGQVVAEKRVPLALLNSGNYQPVVLGVKAGGYLDLIVGTTPVYTDLELPGYEPMSGLKFALYARTGGLNASYWFDNVCLYYSTSVQPLGINSFKADFPEVVSGDPVVLRWDISQQATQITIDNGVGDVTPQTVSGVGSVRVNPTTTTTYTLTIRRGTEQKTASTRVTVMTGVAPNWAVVDNFDTYPAGFLSQTGWWLDLNGNSARVEDRNGNKMLSVMSADGAAVFRLGYLGITEGQERTLFFRMIVSGDPMAALRQVIGLTDKNIRGHSDTTANIGPDLHLNYDPAAPGWFPGVIYGVGGTVEYPGNPLEKDVVYSVWIDMKNVPMNNPLSPYDVFSVYIQKQGQTTRTVLVKDYLSDRDPYTSNPVLGPMAPDLDKLFISGNSATASAWFDDFFLSKSGYSATMPVPFNEGAAPTGYTLTLNPSPFGNITASPLPGANGKYAGGTVVALTANPSAGYSFSSWSGDASGSDNPVTLTMNGNKTVTAHFTSSPLATPQLSYDFNDGVVPAGAEVDEIILPGDTPFPLVDISGGVDNSGVLKLTTSKNGQVGGFRSPLLAGGARLEEFAFAADVLAGNGTEVPADGFSINFAPDLPILPPGDAENGAGTGITVAFDTFDNEDTDPNNGAGEAPAIDVLYRGQVVAHTPVPLALLNSGTYQPVALGVKAGGYLDLIVGTTPVYTDLELPGYQPMSGLKFAVYARTGELNASYWFDNIELYYRTSVAPTLSDVTRPGDPITATSGNSPAGEDVAKAIDNQTGTKYLNFDKLNAGFTVIPSVGPTVVTGLGLTSANDAPERDPASYRLEGSLDGKTFTLIAAGAVPAFAARFMQQQLFFNNTTAYAAYRLIFPMVANAVTANSMQIGEVQLLGMLAPRLNIAYANGLVTLSWDSTANGYGLETTTRLVPPVQWFPVPGVVNNQLTVPGEGSTRFYRLRR